MKNGDISKVEMKEVKGGFKPEFSIAGVQEETSALPMSYPECYYPNKTMDCVTQVLR